MALLHIATGIGSAIEAAENGIFPGMREHDAPPPYNGPPIAGNAATYWDILKSNPADQNKRAWVKYSIRNNTRTGNLVITYRDFLTKIEQDISAAKAANNESQYNALLAVYGELVREQVITKAFFNRIPPDNPGRRIYAIGGQLPPLYFVLKLTDEQGDGNTLFKALQRYLKHTLKYNNPLADGALVLQFLTTIRQTKRRANNNQLQPAQLAKIKRYWKGLERVIEEGVIDPIFDFEDDNNRFLFTLDEIWELSTVHRVLDNHGNVTDLKVNKKVFKILIDTYILSDEEDNFTAEKCRDILMGAAPANNQDIYKQIAKQNLIPGIVSAIAEKLEEYKDAGMVNERRQYLINLIALIRANVFPLEELSILPLTDVWEMCSIANANAFDPDILPVVSKLLHANECWRILTGQEDLINETVPTLLQKNYVKALFRQSLINNPLQVGIAEIKRLIANNNNDPLILTYQNEIAEGIKDNNPLFPNVSITNITDLWSIYTRNGGKDTDFIHHASMADSIRIASLLGLGYKALDEGDYRLFQWLVERNHISFPLPKGNGDYQDREDINGWLDVFNHAVSRIHRIVSQDPNNIHGMVIQTMWDGIILLIDDQRLKEEEIPWKKLLKDKPTFGSNEGEQNFLGRFAIPKPKITDMILNQLIQNEAWISARWIINKRIETNFPRKDDTVFSEYTNQRILEEWDNASDDKKACYQSLYTFRTGKAYVDDQQWKQSMKGKQNKDLYKAFTFPIVFTIAIIIAIGKAYKKIRTRASDQHTMADPTAVKSKSHRIYTSAPQRRKTAFGNHRQPISKT